MLAEFLADRGSWTQVMPGARGPCLFSLEEGPFPLPLRLEPLHFEALFCLAGSITLTRRDNTILTASVRQVLLLTDLSDLSGASVDAPPGGHSGGGGCPGRPGEPANHLRSAGRPDLGHRAGAALDGQPGRLCRGGGQPTGAGRPLPIWTACPRGERARWSCVEVGGAALSALQSERTGGLGPSVGT